MATLMEVECAASDFFLKNVDVFGSLFNLDTPIADGGISGCVVLLLYGLLDTFSEVYGTDFIAILLYKVD